MFGYTFSHCYLPYSQKKFLNYSAFCLLTFTLIVILCTNHSLYLRVTLVLFKILMTLYFAQLNDLKISFKDYAFKLIGHFYSSAISTLVLSQLMAMLAKKVLNVGSSI